MDFPMKPQRRTFTPSSVTFVIISPISTCQSIFFPFHSPILVRYQDSGRSRGYAHILLDDPKYVEQALAKNGQYIGDRYVRVQQANGQKSSIFFWNRTHRGRCSYNQQECHLACQLQLCLPQEPSLWMHRRRNSRSFQVFSSFFTVYFVLEFMVLLLLFVFPDGPKQVVQRALPTLLTREKILSFKQWRNQVQSQYVDFQLFWCPVDE